MILNVDGYKLIFFLENLLRKYVNDYGMIESLNNSLRNNLVQSASNNDESQIDNLEVLLKYSHLGELIDIIKSKNFKKKKYNEIEKINVTPLIKYRNSIMHSRTINTIDVQDIKLMCDEIVSSLDENSLTNSWNRFKSEDINNFTVPSVHIEYPIGKNFEKLIGRNPELRKLKNELKIPMPVSIVGHGGLGKTALVLQLIEDYVFSPEQPFERIYFMSFKNTVFEHGTIRRFEKVISNHNDLIYKLANCMGMEIEDLEFNQVEKKVWNEMFSKKSLLILDNLETEIVKSNLSEFATISQIFTSNFTKPSRLIITSRYGLGDREVKFPLNQFDLVKTKALINEHIGSEIIKEKQVKDIDWEWIQSYTNGNPGLIITFCNTLKSTRKKAMDLRVEFQTQYTYESQALHNQLDEFVEFCFENTIESLSASSQIFLSIICYLCSETNLSEVNEEFLTYLREELELNSLGDENLRATILVNIGFLQSIPDTDRYYANELFINYLDGNFSEDIFNVFKLKKSAWNERVVKLKNHINELQFQEEISLGKLLSQLYISKYKNSSDKKYLLQAFFCLPTLRNLINYYRRASDIEVLNSFSLLDKLSNELKDNRFKSDQNQIVKIMLDSLLKINKKIIERKETNIRQTDLYNFFEQLEIRILLLKNNDVNVSNRRLAIRLLTYLQKFERAEKLLIEDEELIVEKFKLYVKQLGELSGRSSIKCITYINECKKIAQLYPAKVNNFSKAQLKLYTSRYLKIDSPEEALKTLENFEEYFISTNIRLFIFYLESLLIRMECHLKTNGDIEIILALKERFKKQIISPSYSKVFRQKRESIEQNMRRIDRDISQYRQIIRK
ncbi:MULTISPECIES: NB-ARC domain-containing protein [Bacillaceae]|uniref:NB-ARC domain-containing protein n=1 Tax=Evansella alkalicola TaxID=745819 RepID=A0ABS6JQX8_9BACI|nr:MULTISPECIES: NB-ARC domain-containing protein [Bacillaceae]MBU9720966.1 hypothetical protein [Bacillus alkalicola]